MSDSEDEPLGKKLKKGAAPAAAPASKAAEKKAVLKKERPDDGKNLVPCAELAHADLRGPNCSDPSILGCADDDEDDVPLAAKVEWVKTGQAGWVLFS